MYCLRVHQVRGEDVENSEFGDLAFFCARFRGRIPFNPWGRSVFAWALAERAREYWRNLAIGGRLVRGRLDLHPSDSPGAAREPREGAGEVSDRSLLRRLRGGDGDAATQIYLRYARRLEFLAQKQCAPELGARFDAEDVVQSVFRTFFRRAERGEYVVPDGEELWKLLLVIAMNKIRANGAFHRAAKRDVRQTQSAGPVEPPSAGDENALAVLQMVVEQVLEGLGDEYRKIAELRIEGHEVAEIADRTGRAKRSVERLLQEFRKALAAQIGDD